MASPFWFRFLLLACCIAGFFWAQFAQAIGAMVMFNLIFGKPRK